MLFEIEVCLFKVGRKNKCIPLTLLLWSLCHRVTKHEPKVSYYQGGLFHSTCISQVEVTVGQKFYQGEVSWEKENATTKKSKILSKHKACKAGKHNTRKRKEGFAVQFCTVCFWSMFSDSVWSRFWKLNLVLANKVKYLHALAHNVIRSVWFSLCGDGHFRNLLLAYGVTQGNRSSSRTKHRIISTYYRQLLI